MAQAPRVLSWIPRLAAGKEFVSAAAVTVGVMWGAATVAADAQLRAELGDDRSALTFLSWDTEGGDRCHQNLLRSGQTATIRVLRGEEWVPLGQLPRPVQRGLADDSSHRFIVGDDSVMRVSFAVQSSSRITLSLAGEGSVAERLQGIELVLPFDPQVTPTTVLPLDWEADGSLRLPAVISAPDFGSMLLADTTGRRLRGRLTGSRSDKAVDLIVELPIPQRGAPYTLELVPIHLDPPAGLKDCDRWTIARRGWWGALQPTARWGEAGRPFSAPAGILGNNVISDPASCSLWFYADQAFWTPQVTPDISAARMVRRTIDWWLDHRLQPTGEVICYWDYLNFLDANAGPLIAAWDYVESTGDIAWLAQRMDLLERIAEFLASRDVDGDGLVEAVQSGNRGTLQQPHRSCAWWDALNCGHKDGYTNALIYRAWRCLADLERQLGRHDRQARYALLADRLKSAYAATLHNPQTGWLAWWKSEDGELHDYASTVVNGLAIEYGLVEPGQGREILDRLWAKIEEVGFDRFDLGIPPMLVPVARSDYLLPNGLGIPQREDGTDTFGHYMNGGITAGQTLHFLAAHYVVDRPDRADKVLDAMLTRQAAGKFQNGVRDAAYQGIDWTDWQGNPTGYEGYLADSFRFLQAIMLRDPALRARYYRPLHVGHFPRPAHGAP